MGVVGRAIVRLCGPLSVELAGRVVVLPGRQGRLLFAYVAANRHRPVARDDLIELLWPTTLPADPGETLSALLSRTRRALGPEVLVGRREVQLVLAPDAWIDLEAAREAADQADAGLADGDFGSAHAAADRCDEIARRGFLVGDDCAWTHERREEVRELRLRALEAIAAAGTALGGGALPEAERAARAAVEAAPFRESGHRLLMEALAARGNVAEALRAYERLRVLLREELGTAPGADVQTLHQRLLTAGAPAPEQPPPPRRDERRLVTVLCVELAEAGALPDPEERAPGLVESQRRVRAIVEEFGGSPLELGAAGLVAVFGVPVPHEDDADRAVRAALRARELGRAARAGVASGEAIVAMDGREASRLTGRVTGAAVALQRDAPRGAIVVDDATRQATAQRLGYDALEPSVWRVAGERRARRERAPMVGRDGELALLRDRYAEVVADGRPRLVTIVGEAGIGKTRLLDEFTAWVRAQDGAVLRGRCLAYGEGIVYWALREMLWDTAGILLDDDAETEARKLRALATELLGADAGRTTEALAAGAGIRLPGSTLDELSPEALSEEIGLAWPRFLGAVAARAPTVAAIEDLHWAEPPLVDMIERVVARTDGPLLVVATARPELVQRHPGWGQRPGAWQVTLAPLDADSSRALVGGLLPAERAAAADEVVAAAEGNPFFAEEIVRHLAHGGASQSSIPSTVRALLAARIDALPEDEKDVLRHAAVVGRTFWPAALEPTWTDRPLAPRLLALEQRGFVAVRPTSAIPGQRELQFVHGLTREVAYESIPRGARCRVHAAVAAWIEERAGDRRREFIALLAHHYEAAARPADAALAWPEAAPEREELRAKAVRALLDAGEAARRRLALEAALRFVDRVLALAEAPDERLGAFELRARSLHAAVHGNQALDAYLEALEVAQALGDTGATARLRAYAVLLCSRYPGSFTGTTWKHRADELVERGLAEGGEDTASFATGALLVGRAWGSWRWRDPIAEDLPRAKRDAERAVQIAEEIGSALLHSIALEALTWVALSQGDCEAVALGERHLRAAATIADRFEANESLTMAAICSVRAGRFERAREIAAGAAREGAGLGPHRCLHAVASRAIALVPSGRLGELFDATAGVEELIEQERDHICANALVALAARTLALHERGHGLAADGARELFDEVAPVSRPLVRWAPWIIEALRDVIGIDESLERLHRVEVRRGAGNAVDVLRAELVLRALAADWDRVGELAETTRGLASTTCAPALRHIAGWSDAMRLAAEGRTAQALEVGAAATAALAEHGERYNAERLMADLLAGLSTEAPPPLAHATSARLDAMGAHASAAAVRALDGGA